MVALDREGLAVGPLIVRCIGTPEQRALGLNRWEIGPGQGYLDIFDRPVDVGLHGVTGEDAVGPAEAVGAIGKLTCILIVGIARGGPEFIIRQVIHPHSEVEITVRVGVMLVFHINVETGCRLVTRRVGRQNELRDVGAGDLVGRRGDEFGAIIKGQASRIFRAGALGVEILDDTGVVKAADLILFNLVVVDDNAEPLQLLGRKDKATSVGFRLGCLEVGIAGLKCTNKLA